MARMKTSKPARKVAAAALGSAVATIIVWVLNTFVLPPDRLITAEVMGAIATVAAFVVGYFMPPSVSDEVVPG